MTPPLDTHLVFWRVGDTRRLWRLVNRLNRGIMNHAIFIRLWSPIMSLSVRFLSCPNVEVQTRASGFISGWTDGYPLEHGLQQREPTKLG